MVTTDVQSEVSPWEELKNNVDEELAQVKDELKEIVEFLKDPEQQKIIF